MATASTTPKLTTFFVYDDSGQVSEQLTIDATPREQHEHANTISDHPVEQGADISDHVRPQPDRVTLDCRLSDTPLSTSQQTRQVRSGAVTVTTTASQSAPRDNPGVSDASYRKLLAWRTSGQVLVVQTKRTRYESMVIEDVSETVEAKTGGGVTFSVKLKVIRIVKNKLTRTVVAKDKRAGSKVKTGTQNAQAPEQESSALRSMADKGSTSGNGTISGVSKFLLSGGQ